MTDSSEQDSNLDIHHTAVLEQLSETANSSTATSPKANRITKPNRPLKTRNSKKGMSHNISTSPASLSTSPTRQSSALELKSSPLQASPVKESDPNCPCRQFVTEQDPRFCSKCKGTLPGVCKIYNECVEAMGELESLQKQFEVLQIKYEESVTKNDNFTQDILRLESDISKKDAELKVLRRDLDNIGEKLVDEIERRAELQHSKDAVQEELEELTRSLFEEANSMVASEAKQRHKFEEQELALSKQLEQTKLQLQMEQAQLRELKLRMEQSSLENQKLRKRATSVSKNSSPTRSNMQSMDSNTPHMDVSQSIDPLLYSQFEEFMEQSVKLVSSKIHSLAYLKMIQEDDVLPCLRFGGNPKIQGKRLIDSIIKNNVYVEEMSTAQITFLEQRDENIPLGKSESLSGSKSLTGSKHGLVSPTNNSHNSSNTSINNSNTNTNNTNNINVNASQNTSMFSRLLTNASQTVAQMTSSSLSDGNSPGCCTCGRTDEPYKYQFKITDLTADTWYPICLACRSRLVSVCNFYKFIRYCHSGMYSSRKTNDLYLESLKLRRSMFYSRIGAQGFENVDFVLKPSEPVRPNDAFTRSTIVADSLLNG